MLITQRYFYIVNVSFAEFVSIYALKHLYGGYGQGIFSTGLHNKVTQSCVYRISF